MGRDPEQTLLKSRGRWTAVLIPGVLLNALTKEQLATFRFTNQVLVPQTALEQSWQEAETDSHLTVVSRETLTNTCTLGAHSASFLSAVVNWCCHGQGGSLPQLTQLRKSLSSMPRGQPYLDNSPLRLSPLCVVKLTLKTSCHPRNAQIRASARCLWFLPDGHRVHQVLPEGNLLYVGSAAESEEQHGEFSQS